MTQIPAEIPRIQIFRFHDAPREWRDLSTNGGDEDWLAIIPAGWPVPTFLEEGSTFGCFAVDSYALETGETVLIGSHS